MTPTNSTSRRALRRKDPSVDNVDFDIDEISARLIPSKGSCHAYLVTIDGDHDIHGIRIGGLIPGHGAFLVLVGEIRVAVDVAVIESCNEATGFLCTRHDLKQFLRIDEICDFRFTGVLLGILGVEFVLDIPAAMYLRWRHNVRCREDTATLSRILLPSLSMDLLKI